MNTLIIEWRKLSRYKPFWIMGGLFLVIVALVFFQAADLVEGFTINGIEGSIFPVFEFPNIWENMAWLASLFRFLLAVVVIMIMANEFNWKTMRQSVLNGQSRADFMLGKVGIIIILALMAAIWVFLMTLAVGAIKGESPEGYFVGIGFRYAGLYFFQVIGYLLFALGITFLIKRSAFAIGLWLIYSIFLEPILGLIVGDYGDYLPLSSLDALVPNPFGDYFDFSGQNPIPDLEPASLAVAGAWILIAAGLLFFGASRKNL